MIDIKVETNPKYYNNTKSCLDFLRTVHNDKQYQYPKDKVTFHILMGQGVTNGIILETIKSFIATQNLEKTKLIVWTESDDTNNPSIQPYKEYIDMRVWNPIEEVKGTPLEGSSKIYSTDDKYWAQGDLCRIVLLYKYGGIWSDFDVVFINDFKPILDQEMVYQWGSSVDFSIGSEGGLSGGIMSGKINSEFTKKLMEKLVNNKHIKPATHWGKELLLETWNETKSFSVLPSIFFNTEWNKPAIIEDKGVDSYNACFNKWFNEELDDLYYMFDELPFSWHWHNSGPTAKKAIENNSAAKNSKFDLLRQRTDRLLKEKGII